jgi:hypothetical protein
MPRLTPLFQTAVAVVLLMLMLPACAPPFNWREVRPENTRLGLLLPCKPDHAKRTVPLGGKPVELAMLGCDAGGATFAVAVADLGDAANAGPVLAQWQALTLANMKAAPVPQPSQIAGLKIPGAELQPAPLLIKADGQRANGRPVRGQAAYFARGSQVFQAVLYAEKISAEVSDTFFSSLKFD